MAWSTPCSHPTPIACVRENRSWILQQILPPRVARQDTLSPAGNVGIHHDRLTGSILRLMVLKSNHNETKENHYEERKTLIDISQYLNLVIA
jgi:hypothetical protein